MAISEHLQLSPRDPEKQTCPLCREHLAAADPGVAACSGCDTHYHASCFEELGGCSTLGCVAATRAAKPPAERQLRTRPRQPRDQGTRAKGGLASVFNALMCFLLALVGAAYFSSINSVSGDRVDEVPIDPTPGTRLAERVADRRQQLNKAAAILRLEESMADVKIGIERNSNLFHGSLRYSILSKDGPPDEIEIQLLTTVEPGPWSFAGGRTRGGPEGTWEELTTLPYEAKVALSTLGADFAAF